MRLCLPRAGRRGGPGAEFRPAVAPPERAATPARPRSLGRGARPGWGGGGGPDGPRLPTDRGQGHPGAQAAARADAQGQAPRWGAQAAGPQGPGVGGGARGDGGACHPGRSGVAAALDVQEHSSTGRRPHPGGAPGELPDGRRPAAPSRLQPASRLEDARAHLPSRPGSPVPVPGRPGPGSSGRTPTGGLGGHQEEGAGGSVQERGPGVAAGRGARGGQHLRLHRRGRQGRPLRRVRRGGERGMGLRRPRPRHGHVRRPDPQAMVADCVRTEAVPTATGSGCGSSSWRSSPRRPD